MIRLIALLLAVSLALPAAAASRAEKAAAKAELERQAARPITCTAGTDCEMKWGKALRWVIDNSTFKIQTQSDSLIATYGPEPDHPDLAFIITKTLQPGGVYAIEFSAACDNMFGCVPSVLESKASFSRALLGV